METHTTTAVLGAELREKLFDILKEMGAVWHDERWLVVGSQEIVAVEITLCGRQIRVEAETFVGLTLTGPRDVVERIQIRIASSA
jgi:hypothetical protein